MRPAMPVVPAHILEAMRLMKAGDLAAATAVLRSGGGAAPPSESAPVDPIAPQDPVPSGGSFTSQAFAGPEGARPYKLFVPTRTGIEPRPLVLMLHGCTQDPDDFARGTRMNALAEAHGGGRLVRHVPASPVDRLRHLPVRWKSGQRRKACS